MSHIHPIYQDDKPGELQHTAGPWEISEQIPWANAVALVELSPERHLSVIAPRLTLIPKEDYEANANLIAAAPELLAELQGIAETLEKMAPCPEEILDQLAERARTICRKAKGEL